MMVKIYVDWNEQEVRLEADKEEWITEYAADHLSSDSDLENFLDDVFDGTEHYRYPKAYLLNAPEGAREEIIDKFKKHAYKEAEEEFYDTHEEIEIEI